MVSDIPRFSRMIKDVIMRDLVSEVPVPRRSFLTVANRSRVDYVWQSTQQAK